MATRQKIVTLAEEVRRRMMNMDRQSTKKERLEVLRKFSQKLEDSSYSKDVRQEILKSGLTRYYRLVLQEVAGGRKLYRSAQEMKDGRSLKLHRAKSWFKSRRGGGKIVERMDFPERYPDQTRTDALGLVWQKM